MAGVWPCASVFLLMSGFLSRKNRCWPNPFTIFHFVKDLFQAPKLFQLHRSIPFDDGFQLKLMKKVGSDAFANNLVKSQTYNDQQYHKPLGFALMVPEIKSLLFGEQKVFYLNKFHLHVYFRSNSQNRFHFLH